MRLHLVKQSVHFPNHLALTILWICSEKSGIQVCNDVDARLLPGFWAPKPWQFASFWSLLPKQLLQLQKPATATSSRALGNTVDIWREQKKHCNLLSTSAAPFPESCMAEAIRSDVATLQSMLRTHETVHWYSNHYFLSSWLFEAFLDGKVRIGKQCLAGWSFSVLLLLK